MTTKPKINPWNLYSHFTAKQVCALAVGEDPEKELSSEGKALWRVVRESMLKGEIIDDIQGFLPKNPAEPSSPDIDRMILFLKKSTAFAANKQYNAEVERRLFTRIRIHREAWRRWFATFGETPSFLCSTGQAKDEQLPAEIILDGKEYPRLLRVALEAWETFYCDGKTLKRDTIVEKLTQWDEVHSKREAQNIDFIIRPDEMKKGGHIKNPKSKKSQ